MVVYIYTYMCVCACVCVCVCVCGWVGGCGCVFMCLRLCVCVVSVCVRVCVCENLSACEEERDLLHSRQTVAFVLSSATSVEVSACSESWEHRSRAQRELLQHLEDFFLPESNLDSLV